MKKSTEKELSSIVEELEKMLDKLDNLDDSENVLACTSEFWDMIFETKQMIKNFVK